MLKQPYRMLLLLALFFLWTVQNAGASSLVPQTNLPGTCIPQFAVPLPVFGPAGSIPRVDTVSHSKITVRMREINQSVLPVGMHSLSGEGCPNPPGTLKKTRLWAYETLDTKNGKILGAANWPAVTIEARRGHPTRVTYVNQLPSFNPNDPTGPGLVQGLLDEDQTLHWADPLTAGCGMPLDCSGQDADNYCCKAYTGPQPTVTHLHGAEQAACYDGNADQWFTPDGRIGPRFCTDGRLTPGQDIYTYQNAQEPGTLWFHDHTLGLTQGNVIAGLAGFYFLREPSEEPKKLPAGPYEIEMALQDRLFDTNSQLQNMPPTLPQDHPFWFTRFQGDVAIVNGAAWPYLKVEPRRYRFRILNGANGRRFALTFGGAPVWQIGADDNYFDKPLKVNGTACAGDTLPVCSDLFLTPGERADIIVDFSRLAGKIIVLSNSLSPDAGLPNIMQFKVVLPLRNRDKSCDPAKPDPVAGVCARRTPIVRLTDGKGHLAPGVKIDKVRQFVLTPTNDGDFVNNTKWNGLLSPNIDRDFPYDGVSELPRIGSTELWEFITLEQGGPGHPMHTHLAQFQILNRQQVDLAGYQAAYDAAFGSPGSAPLPASCTKGIFCPDYGPPLDYLAPNDDGALGGNPAFSDFIDSVKDPILPPTPGESGWKDVAVAFGGQVLRIVVRWTPTDVRVIPNESYAGRNLYNFDPTNGYYVWHCHFLGHEDNEMMRPYRVTK